MIGIDGSPVIQPDRLRTTPECKKMTDEQFFIFSKSKTFEELEELTPKNNLGEAFIHILSNCIKPENTLKAAEIFSYITKINNKKSTDKAEWVITKDELKKFHDVIKGAKENLSPMINGQVDNILEQYYAELVTKSIKSK